MAGGFEPSPRDRAIANLEREGREHKRIADLYYIGLHRRAEAKWGPRQVWPEDSIQFWMSL